MGIGNWIDRKMDNGVLDKCEKTLQATLDRADLDNYYRGDLADGLALTLGSVFPHLRPVSSANFYSVAETLEDIPPNRLVDISLVILKHADRVKHKGAGGEGAASSLVAGWFMATSRMASAHQEVQHKAYRLCRTYKDMLYALLV